MIRWFYQCRHCASLWARRGLCSRCQTQQIIDELAELGHVVWRASDPKEARNAS